MFGPPAKVQCDWSDGEYVGSLAPVSAVPCWRRKNNQEQLWSSDIHPPSVARPSSSLGSLFSSPAFDFAKTTWTCRRQQAPLQSRCCPRECDPTTPFLPPSSRHFCSWISLSIRHKRIVVRARCPPGLHAALYNEHPSREWGFLMWSRS